MSERSSVSRLHALAQAYRPRLRAQLEALRGVLLERGVAEIEAIAAARALAHRIRGSAGSYGFHGVSEACAGVEESLRGALEEGTEAPDRGALAATIRSLLATLDEDPGEEPEEGASLLLICADPEERARLAERLRAQGRRPHPVDGGREAALCLFERSFEALLLVEDERVLVARAVLPALAEIVGELPPALVVLREDDAEHRRLAEQSGASSLVSSSALSGAEAGEGDALEAALKGLLSRGAPEEVPG